jgi:hypothetical protein
MYYILDTKQGFLFLGNLEYSHTHPKGNYNEQIIRRPGNVSEKNRRPGVMVYACNLSYNGNRGRRSMKSARAKLVSPYTETKYREMG